MKTLLKVGDIVSLKAGHKVYTDLPKCLVYSNQRDSKEFTHSDITIEGVFSYLAGIYLVYDVKTDGGGYGMGIYDPYPDGHHVFCQSLEFSGLTVDFFQTGSFTAMITDIEPEN